MESHIEQPQTSASGVKQSKLNPQYVIAALSLIMALQMTSYVMITPLFARRFEEFGAGVKALGMSSMAFAITSVVAAPFMGALSDRLGRRPLILGSLAMYMAAFLGYLLAPSVNSLIAVRGLAGAFTAGLIPAVTGLASDIAPQQRRAQWIGFVVGGASFGWVAGPIAGGMIFDHWGYNTALTISIAIASLTFVIALLAISNRYRTSGQTASEQWSRQITGQRRNLLNSMTNLRSTLPRSLPAFVALLFICLAVMFAWAFMEPEFMFYVYNDLGWSSSMLGLAMSAYGATMMLGEFGFGRLSDWWGRKPVILTGLVLFSTQFIGLALFSNYTLITASFAIAGMGNALFDPALTASILDISPTGHHARILGIKHSASLLGNILGPALIVLVTSTLSAVVIFMMATGMVMLAIVVGLSIRMVARHAGGEPETVTCLLQ